MAWRMELLVIEGFVALSAAVGGIALSVGPYAGGAGITMPNSYLEGTPFDSYLIPGILLFLVIGGTHLGAFILLLRWRRLALVAVGVSGSGMLIWVFVEMIVIPFSFLQALYFGCGLLELVLALLLLDVLRPRWKQRMRPSG